jgi:hypothetical protein
MHITEHRLFKITEKYTDAFLKVYGAHKALIRYHEKGTHLITEPYLEIEVYWHNATALVNHASFISDMAASCQDLIHAIDLLGGLMVEPLWEMSHSKKPILVWAVFFSAKSGKIL